MYDFKHSIERHTDKLGNEIYKDAYNIVEIVVKPMTEDKSVDMTVFKIKNSAPGLFDEVKSTLKPFSFGFIMQGGFKDEHKMTTIIMQRFELQRKTLNYFETTGVTQKK